jgi:hypothetical protein
MVLLEPIDIVSEGSILLTDNFLFHILFPTYLFLFMLNFLMEENEKQSGGSNIWREWVRQQKV